jgi:hypothetical protein
MTTCERGHAPITYDDVLGLVPCPLCEVLAQAEEMEERLAECTLCADYNAQRNDAVGVGAEACKPM